MNRFLSSVRRLLRPMLIPVLALFTALVIGAVIMWIFGDPPLKAYKGLFEGAFGDPKAWARTIRKMSPFILAGLSVAVAFKAGLFNIGASGQFLMGTVASVAVGINFDGLPAAIHLPLALLAGIAGGAAWGAIPGILKVYTGAHEVIVTIMLNYIAANFAGWLVYAGGSQGQTPGPLWDRTARAISETPDVLASAQIPWLFGPPYRVHSGIILALLAAVLMAWLIYKTIIGFEIRTVGQNVKAARVRGRARQANHHSDDDDCGWAGGPGRRYRDPGPQPQICAGIRRRRRLRWHHHRAAGPDASARRGAVRLPVRGPGCRRSHDAVPIRRRDRHHPGDSRP